MSFLIIFYLASDDKEKKSGFINHMLSHVNQAERTVTLHKI